MMKTLALTVMATFCAAVAYGETRVDQTKPAEPDGDVEIHNVMGSVKVTGWDRSEVRVVGTLDDDVDEFVFEVDNDETEIRVELPGGNRKARRGKVELEIHVPFESNVEVKTITASIDIHGVAGDELRLQAINAGVSVVNCQSDVEAEVINGDVVLEGIYGSVHAETVNGNITVRTVTEEVNAETISGNIEVVAGALRDAEFETLSGNIRYEGGLSPDGRIEVGSHSGRVELVFTEAVHGRYEIETFSGNIDVPFGPEPRRKNRFAPGHELDFTHGDGDARVKVESFSGPVVIREQ